MSSDHIIIDTESSSDTSPTASPHSVVHALLKNKSARAQAHTPLKRGRARPDVGLLSGNIWELITDGLRKVSKLCFHHK